MQKINEKFRAMGTEIEIDIILGHLVPNWALSAFKGQAPIESVKNIFSKNEKIFSRFSPDSELSKINNSLGKEIEISREMFEVLELCLKFHEISEGYFDPRIIGDLERIGYDKDFKSNDLNTKEPRDIAVEKISSKLSDDLLLNKNNETVLVRKRIDTTGIAKGYTVDEAAEFLKKAGYQNFIVDAGGDMFAEGFDQDGEDWRIGVEGLEDDKLMLKLHNQGIATSGISRKKWEAGGKKYHHLVNPKKPADFSWDLKTVTVIKEKTVEADGRAKVLFLMGWKNGLGFANKNNLKALFLDYKNNIYLSEAIKSHIV